MMVNYYSAAKFMDHGSQVLTKSPKIDIRLQYNSFDHNGSFFFINV